MFGKTLDLMVGWLVLFYGISTRIGYLKPNPIYIYIYIYIYVCVCIYVYIYFNLIHRWDPNRKDHSGSEWT